MSDDEADNDNAEAADKAKETKQEPEPPKKVIPPTQKGKKNTQGDYIVEKFEIPDFRDGVREAKDKESSDDDSSDDDYGNEDNN